MPVLSHFHKDRAFRIEESEVVRWLIAQPELMQFIFNLCKNAGVIVYENGRWRGTETQRDADE